MRIRPYSVSALALGGAILMALGLYFAFLRPPLLPEDARFMGTSLAQVQATLPGLPGWLRQVFRVLGGYIFATGLLTIYLAATAFRARAGGVAGVLVLAGLTSIGLMAVVNFSIGSDFKWLILSFGLPWPVALALYWVEGRDA